MKRVAIGLGIAAIALAVTVVVALASNASDGSDGTAAREQLSASAATSTKPYIGVVITDLSAEKAQELQVAGGVEIREVVAGSPADGKLQVGDVVTAVNGDAVTTGELFRQRVLASNPGDSLRLSVLRSGSVVQVDVTVGETQIVTKLSKRLLHGFPGDLAGLLGDPNKLVRAEIVVEGENGYETITAVAGTIVSVDVAGGKLALKPKDSSATVEYQIGEDTVILSEGELGAENRAIVVAKDGVASLVVQGDFLDRVAPFGGHHFRKGLFGRGGIDFPRIQRSLRMLPDGPMDRDIRVEIEKFMGDHLPMFDEFEIPKDISDGCIEEHSDGRTIIRCIERTIATPQTTQ
jgi:hypothetical protein